jgi:hypothetical protein
MGAMMAISAGAQGLNSISSGISQSASARAQGDFQKQQYDTNARLADLNASDAIARGEVDAGKHEAQTRGLAGSQRAALAAQGIDVDSGSAADVQKDTATLGALDATTIKNNAWREAWGYKVQAANSTAQGAMAKSAGDFSATSSLLTGGMNAVSSFGRAGYEGSQAGWFKKKG